MKMNSLSFAKIHMKIYAKIESKYMTEEVVQETYKIASENKDKVLAHPQPEVWLYKTAVNIYKNKMRKNIKIQNNERYFDRYV